MTLTSAESARYARHLVLKGIGGTGQQRIKAARVLVVGAGGLGSPVIAYLAAAGVGTLGVADPDSVSVSNLQRQIIFSDADEGAPKTRSAERFVAGINPHLRFVPHAVALNEANAAGIVALHQRKNGGTGRECLIFPGPSIYFFLSINRFRKIVIQALSQYLY